MYKSASCCQLVFSSLDSGQAGTHGYRLEQENSHSCLALHLVLFSLKRKASVSVCRAPLGKKKEKKLMTFCAQPWLWLWLNCDAWQTVTTLSATSYVHHRSPDSHVRAARVRAPTPTTFRQDSREISPHNTAFYWKTGTLKPNEAFVFTVCNYLKIICQVMNYDQIIYKMM